MTHQQQLRKIIYGGPLVNRLVAADYMEEHGVETFLLAGHDYTAEELRLGARVALDIITSVKNPGPGLPYCHVYGWGKVVVRRWGHKRVNVNAQYRTGGGSTTHFELVRIGEYKYMARKAWAMSPPPTCLAILDETMTLSSGQVYGLTPGVKYQLGERVYSNGLVWAVVVREGDHSLSVPYHILKVVKR